MKICSGLAGNAMGTGVWRLVYYVAHIVEKADGWHSTEMPSCPIIG